MDHYGHCTILKVKTKGLFFRRNSYKTSVMPSVTGMTNASAGDTGMLII